MLACKIISEGEIVPCTEYAEYVWDKSGLSVIYRPKYIRTDDHCLHGLQERLHMSQVCLRMVTWSIPSLRFFHLFVCLFTICYMLINPLWVVQKYKIKNLSILNQHNLIRKWLPSYHQLRTNACLKCCLECHK